MSMIKCKECGKEISDKAVSCPECGYVYKKQKTGVLKIALISFLTILISGCLLFGGIYLFTEYIPKAKIDKEIKSFYGNYELVESNLDDLKKIEYYNSILKDDEVKKEIELSENNTFKDGDLINSVGYGNFDSGFAFSKNKEDGVILVASLDQVLNTDNKSKIDFEKDGKYLSLVSKFCYFDDEINQDKCVDVTIKYKEK